MIYIRGFTVDNKPLPEPVMTSSRMPYGITSHSSLFSHTDKVMIMFSIFFREVDSLNTEANLWSSSGRKTGLGIGSRSWGVKVKVI